MAREYPRVQDFYMQLNEIPPVMHYSHFEMTPTVRPFELTVESSVETGAGGSVVIAQLPANAPVSVPQPHQQYYDIQPRTAPTQYAECYNMANLEAPVPSSSVQVVDETISPPRKRKPSSYGTCSTYDDDGTEDTRSTRTLPDKKQNHSEIEKRRRDKMNTYISELSTMIPMCGAMSRKLDKLTVLRMAVQHMRTVRGALSAGPLTAQPRPAFLSEPELNQLVLNAAQDAFMMVVGCDRGRLLYVSESVIGTLYYEQSELIGQSLFDILHPKDVAKVKEQLASSDLSPRERLIDAKTMLPVKADVVSGASRFCPGARRSFFCRIKCRATNIPPKGANCTVTSATFKSAKDETDSPGKSRKKNEKKYCVVQCTGYLKSWAPADLESDATSEMGEDGDHGNLTCLVAVGRALSGLSPIVTPPTPPPPPTPPSRSLEYISRHTTDGKFLFVDQRVTLALGFLPQELLGTSLYEYVSASELGAVARTHKMALLNRESMSTPPYSFKKKDGTLTRIITQFKPFRNPWTKDVECLVANNTVVTETYPSLQDDSQASCMYKQDGDAEMQQLIDSQVESYNIGCAIAEEALRRPSPDLICDVPAELIQDAAFNQQTSLVDNLLEMDMENYSEIRNNVTLGAAGGEISPPLTDTTDDLPSTSPDSASPPLSTLGIDGNGEAAMAVIMSLLEADAGLGGPVNFSGLPWPLP